MSIIVDFKPQVGHLEHCDLADDDFSKGERPCLAFDEKIVLNLGVLEFKGEPVLFKLVLLICGEHLSEHALELVVF